MKTYKNIFIQVVAFDNLMLAHYHASKGKKHRDEVLIFEQRKAEYCIILGNRLVKQTYLSCADRILNNMLQRWGKTFEDISAEGDGEPYHTIDYFSELPMEFSRKFLEEFLKQKGLRTPVRNIICNWRRWGWVEKYQKGEDKNIFRKTGKK